MTYEYRDDDATAQTLNYALGNLGGKQKSWMVLPSNASPPVTRAELSRAPLPFAVRGRGRPRKQPAPAPAPAAPTRPTIERPPERRAYSNPTSPQFANVVAPQNTTSYHVPATPVLPSPASSEENIAFVAAAPAGAVQDIRPEARRDRALYAAHVDYPPEVSVETVSMGPAQRTTSISKRPMDGQTGHGNKRSRGGEIGQERPASRTGMPSPTVAGPWYPEFPRRPSAPQSHNGSPMSEHMQIRSPSLGNHQLTQGRTPPQPQPQPQVPRSLPQGVPQQVSTPQYANPPLPSWYTRQECMRILNTFEASHGPLPRNSRDTGRLQVLKDATEAQDWAYLTMHQYYCVLTSAPETLPPALQNQPNLSRALEIVRDVLDRNETLSPAVLDFFCNYPYSVEHIAATWGMNWNDQAQRFLEFVAQSPYYNVLRQSCDARGYPPLAGELSVDLRIVSTTFQRLVFTAFLRRISHPFSTTRATPQARFEERAVAVFQQNQVDCYQRMVDVPFKNIQQERQREYRLWGPKLMEVVQNYRQISLANQQQQQQHQPHYHQPYNSPSYLPTSSMPPRPNRSAESHSAQAVMQRTQGRGQPPVLPAQPGKKPRSFFPMPNDLPIPQQREPHPVRFSLHQANLRSPVLRARMNSSPLYTFTDGFIQNPTPLSQAGRVFEKWSFKVLPSDMQMIPQTVSIAMGDPGVRHVNENNKTFRLRCIKWPGAELPNEHVWAVADTSWIPYSYFNLNGTALQQRKKVYNGKDLPIDITGLLKDGENVFEIAVIAKSGDTTHLNYLIAIEAVRVSSQQSIKQNCLEHNRVSAEQVLEGTKNKLSGNDDDDEIQMVGSSLTIGLFDPFAQASICNIPVRGKACLHNDCFDLDTFLETRSRKGDASVPDQWKCPICNADARPHMLIVDGFLEDVKSQLQSQGRSRTRQIIVQHDGTWKPKAEVREGVSDRGVSDEPSTPDGARQSVSVPAEIIDLSD